MKICRLKIVNFRGIRSATIFLPDHAVLIGDNNVGKTTILEALDLVLGPDRLNRTPPIDEHDFFQGRYLGPSSTEDEEDGEPEAPSKIAPAEVAVDEHGSETQQVIEVVVQTSGSVSPAQASSALGADAAAPTADETAENASSDVPQIEIEVTVVGLTDEQKGRFGDYIEFWDTANICLYEKPDVSGVDATQISEALRVTFVGVYDFEEDDFEGKTYFTRSLTDGGAPVLFSKRDKQTCGFLYLRSLRTGTRALSLERGSLLDIILRLKEVRPRMWEDTISTLADYSVASDPELGISGVLESINTALKKYVPREWGIEPHLKVSNLTRDHLRKVITAFIATGEGSHAAPFYRQGTGTINMLVLAMLSQIAEDKQNVIFAMEEPETAIPPYAQKRIVHEIRKLASQTLFTSHSPYVLEEFALEETLVLSRDSDGVLSQSTVSLPPSIKPKRYRQEFRTRFCEGLLARRVLVAEGATEASAFPVVCRRLAELKPDAYSSLESLGICTVDAGGETNIADLAKLFRNLGKRTFSICDKQTDTQKGLIEAEVGLLLMHDEKSFEELVLKNTTQSALKRFAGMIDWPPHLAAKYPNPENEASAALSEYFGWTKGNWGIADFLAQCSEAEIPQWLREACIALKLACEAAPETATNSGSHGTAANEATPGTATGETQ